MSVRMKKSVNNIDSNLVVEYQKGNKKAIAVLVKRWHLRFCEFAFWYVKDADVAKDIAQESWSVIINKLETLQEPKKFKSWAISIVNRKAIDWIRAKNREENKLKKYSEENPSVLIEESIDSQDGIKLALLNTIETLSSEQQIVLKLFYTQDYTLKEISEILNISVGTIKSRLFHAREKLKSTLKNRNYGEYYGRH